MTEKKLLIFYVICFICVIVALFCIYRSDGYSNVKKILNADSFTVLTKELVPRERIAAEAEDLGILYLFYEECGLVNVYSATGKFKYGIQVGSSNNGRGDMALVNGTLYIKSRTNVIFRFDGSQFLDSTAYSYSASVSGDHHYTDLEKAMTLAHESSVTNRFQLEDSGWVLQDTRTGEPVSFLPVKSSVPVYLKAILALLVMGIILALRKRNG